MSMISLNFHIWSLLVGHRLSSAADPAHTYFEKWSSGFFADIRGVGNLTDTNSFLLQTTVDALPGNSGGPLLNSQGNVVGVITNGAESEEDQNANGYAYIGKESPAGNIAQSSAVPCESLALIK